MYTALIVGCGNIAGGYDVSAIEGAYAKSHAGAYRKNPNITVIACVDPVGEQAEEFANYWDIDAHYTDVRKIPEDQKFDVVSICSPTSFHFDAVLACIRFRPQVIFIEKPICATSAESRELKALCMANDIHLIVNYSRRWDNKISDIIDRLNDGDFGQIRSVIATYNKGILNNGSHMLDLLQRIVGPLHIVHACVREGSSQANHDPDIDAILRSETDVLVHLVSTEATDFSLFELKLITSNAEISMLDGGLRWSIRGCEDHSEFAGYQKLGELLVSDGGYLPVMEAAINSIVDQLEGHCFRIGGIDTAITVQELCEALIRCSYE
ncbi:Gfo/Idh/MocA family protein [Thalassolituus oleivorans]|uniref:Gfo/Idh/MocA family protein n=1 Tax=Thalassolituus oleivorans TaxID=187493 RepID=UPI0023F3DF93|nr:Gfo/Idh/MocA family oxidoreductase [Thalassolituus oleivorans]